MFYMTPYPPGDEMIERVAQKGADLMAIYALCIELSKKTCAEEGITCIPLDHFTNKERSDSGTGIPEPTPEGAKALAVLIHDGVLKQIQKEESEN